MEDIKAKGLEMFLDEEPSLKQKITYEEYKQGKIVPSNSDHKLEDAYNTYINMLEGK